MALGACDRAPEEIMEESVEGPRQILWDFVTTESDSGRLKWILHGEKALFFDTHPQVRASGVRVELYDDEGRRGSVLQADSAFLERQGGKGDMVARGNVYVLSRDSVELWSSELTWVADDRMFRSDSFVEVREGRDLHSGYKVSCDESLGRLWIDSLPRHEIITEEGVLP